MAWNDLKAGYTNPTILVKEPTPTANIVPTANKKMVPTTMYSLGIFVVSW
jgi:hypothetical protein